MNNKLITVAIAEDYQLFRKGLVSMLREQEGISVLFDAENGQELLQQLQVHKPDVILLDIRMPVMDGKEALDLIQKNFESSKVVILTMHYSENYISEFITAGAAGFLPKNCDIEKIVEAIRTVYKQGYYYDNSLSKSVVSELIKSGKNSVCNSLTERETEIAQLLCEDKTATEISSVLRISVRTVEWHKRNIFRKTGTKSLAGLVIYAIKLGIISNPEELFN